MEKYAIPQKVVNVIKALYIGFHFQVVCSNSKLMDKFNITTSLTQE